MKQYDETQLTYKAKNALEYMLDALNEYKSEAEKYKAAVQQDFKIQPFKSYNYGTVEFKWINKKETYYSSKHITSKNLYGGDYELNETVETLENYKKLDAEIYKENELIAKSNTVAYDNLIKLFQLMGLKLTQPDSKSRKFIKPSVDVDFVKEIRGQCKTYAPSSVGYAWDSLIERVKKEEADRNIAVNEVKKQKEAADKESAKTKLFIDLIKKYDFNFPSGLPSADDLLDAILNKNKYLYLAHYLSLNRDDWNDGYSYAETGLNGFSVETEEDIEIYADVYSYFEDFSDGRVWRDSEWNYTRLFSMVPADLMEDYSKVNEYISRF
jgi:hypothetical protein